MKKKDNYTENDSFAYDEKQPKQVFFVKNDCELFLDENDIPGNVVQVKRICGKDGSENWKLLVDKQEKLLLKGSRFTEKEKEFLRSPTGMLFMINGVKCGWNSVSEFKKRIKENL